MYRLHYRLALFACVCLAVLATSAPAAVIRVKWDSPADGPGDDWSNAFQTVTAAMAASVAGDEIWVAGDASHPYVENITLKDGVGLYGGFAGAEASREERDWRANFTILDGSGAGDVVTAASGGSASTVLDGFTVRNGRRGIYSSSSSPSITNNTISGNSQYGIYCYSSSSPTITNNIVAFNATGIYTSRGSPVLRSNCVYNPNGKNYRGLSAGTGDISVDPLLVNHTGGNFHLSPMSPCINAGLDTAVGDGWLDMDGQPRVLGAHVDIGADEFLATAMAAARAAAAGAPVALPAMPVTAAWPDVFYVEQPDRACGIRVEKAGHGLAAGQSATVEGVMGTTTDGERMINATSASGSAGQALPALGMTSRSLGGADSAGYSAADGTGQQGVTGGTGLNNIGLLVRVAGRVTFVDPGGQFFTLWDGSVVEDADGHDGVRVSAPGLTLPALDEFATVTGISSCYKSGADLYPRVLARTAGDIVTQVF